MALTESQQELLNLWEELLLSNPDYTMELTAMMEFLMIFVTPWTTGEDIMRIGYERITEVEGKLF